MDSCDVGVQLFGEDAIRLQALICAVVRWDAREGEQDVQLMRVRLAGEI
jgi:hypothetical protein